MLNKLQFKIAIILTIFIILVMAVIATTLLNNVFSYYKQDFTDQMESFFDKGHVDMLSESLDNSNYVENLKDKLTAYSSFLGIDPYRSFYILDQNGDFLDSNADVDSIDIAKTKNLISAINGADFSGEQYTASNVMDYAVRLENDQRCVIIYIADTQVEMRSVSSIIFRIIVQALLVGMIIAIVLSFVLSSAISAPIKKITATASLISEGDFSQRVTVHSKDEIGELSQTFNYMAKELKSNLDEISGEREKLSTIFSYLKDGVIAFDSNGNILHVNQTAIDLLQNDYTEKMSLSDFINILEIDCSLDEIESSTKAGDGKVFYDIEFKNRVIDLNLGGFRFELSGKPYIGYIVVMHDVTEHFELEQARREFVANVSHELRTPLTGIKGAAETIIENQDMPIEMTSHFLKMIVGESDRMTRIVHDLLMLSRLDNNRVSWEISSFSPEELLRNRIEIMQHEARRHSQTLSIEKVRGVIPEITADREKIDQVLTNIIQNALKYTQDGGNINVALSLKNIKSDDVLKEGKYIVFSVTDNGMGIPSQDIPHIFERFYRVEKARSSEKGGTGLGLAISKDIVMAHGGNITIKSALEKGTTINIYLPLKCAIKG